MSVAGNWHIDLFNSLEKIQKSCEEQEKLLKASVDKQNTEHKYTRDEVKEYLKTNCFFASRDHLVFYVPNKMYDAVLMYVKSVVHKLVPYSLDCGKNITKILYENNMFCIVGPETNCGGALQVAFDVCINV